MISTFDYSTEYSPSAPMVDVTVRANESDRGIELPMLVDSGADATMIPLRFLTRMGAESDAPTYMRGVSGVRVPVNLYEVRLQIGRKQFREYVIGDPVGNEPILGRDILNKMRVTLDGLANTVELHYD